LHLKEMKDKELRQAPLSVRLEALEKDTTESAAPTQLHAGDLCPTCGVERLDYDGLLNLSCPQCGPAQSGCFT
jgi:hypothetical protein